MSSAERNSRIQKLNNLKETGINPYPSKYKTVNYSNSIKQIFKDEEKETFVRIAGRVILVRDFGKATFMTVKDKEGSLQIYGQKAELNEKYNRPLFH